MNWASLDWTDVAIVVGFVAVVYGVAHWSSAAAWIVGGCGCLMAGLSPLWVRRGE